jgi:hypothetical protein
MSDAQVQSAPAVKGMQAVMQPDRPIGSGLPRRWTGQRPADDHGRLQGPGATPVLAKEHTNDYLTQ